MVKNLEIFAVLTFIPQFIQDGFFLGIQIYYKPMNVRSVPIVSSKIPTIV